MVSHGVRPTSPTTACKRELVSTDEILEDAVCGHLEILGEAASKVSDGLRGRLSRIRRDGTTVSRGSLTVCYSRWPVM